ncbi:MAG: glutathione peroxidase [Myxococcales bacterium]|nr:glutathione peroxidase [Myxococcales bacterium]
MHRAHLLAAALLALPLAACKGQDPASADAPPKAAEAESPARTAEAEGADASAAEKEKTEAADAKTGDGPVIAHVVDTLDGAKQDLGELRGKAVLIVNTASQCGYTPQYANLQELYGRYKDRGLVVLGFPSNDFGAQEPGSADEIKEFVQSKYAVDFPMMAKVHAKGPEIAPLYKTLTEETGEGIAGAVEWNFTKFLISPEGQVVARFDSAVDPMSDEVVAAVERALPKAG